MDVNIIEKKHNLPLALLSSFLVGAVGATLWGLLYYYGGFAAIVSFLTSYLMMVVYQKFYPKKDWKCYAWITAVSIILNLLACYETIIIAVMISADCSHAVASQAFFATFDEIAGSVIFDAVMAVIFSVIGVVGYYLTDKKKQQKVNASNGNTIRPTTYTTVDPTQTQQSTNSDNTEE